MNLDLPASNAAWGSGAFAETLVSEVRAHGLDAGLLSRLSTSGYVLDTGWSVLVITVRADAETIVATLGVQLQEIDVGCSCGFEAEPRPAYGEVSVTIDRASGRALIEP